MGDKEWQLQEYILELIDLNLTMHSPALDTIIKRLEDILNGR